ncbi:MAG: hypothetical protein ACERKN_17435 [Velocimicrobium sp.]
MKSKVYILFLILVLVFSLSACSTNKPNSITNNDNPSSSPITNTSTNDATIHTPSPEDENSLPTNAYKAVLQNDIAFISTEDNLEFFLNDFLSRNSEYEGIYKVTHFTVIDMDGDQISEVILELSLGDYPDQYEILHYSNGKVYGYNYVYRGFEMPKEDGTYSYANSASDVGTEKILNFNSDAVEIETLGYAQSDYSGENIVISYFVNNASVAKEDFDAFIDQQNKKKDLQWYAFSAENIEEKVF